MFFLIFQKKPGFFKLSKIKSYDNITLFYCKKSEISIACFCITRLV